MLTCSPPAQAGFNGGEETEFYALPTSGTGNIMYLEEYGNTGIPGEWMFELGPAKIVRCKAGLKGDTCDSGGCAGLLPACRVRQRRVGHGLSRLLPLRRQRDLQQGDGRVRGPVLRLLLGRDLPDQ